MAKTNTETLPCPFCGSEPIDFTMRNKEHEVYFHCENHDGGCPIAGHPMSLDEWNRRSPDKPEAEAVARLNKLADSLDTPKASCEGKWVAEKIREAING